jgi:gliding motility-associated-like protein
VRRILAAIDYVCHKIGKPVVPLILFTVSVQAQSNTRIEATNYCDYGGGGFTINHEKGCAPHTVEVTNTVPGVDPANIQYYFNYHPVDGISGTGMGTSYTYTTPGTYTILQLGTGINKSACRVVTVLDSRKPEFTVTRCGNRRVKVIINNNTIAQQYDQLEIRWNDGNSDFIPKGSSSGAILEIEHEFLTTGSKNIQVRGLYNNGGTCGGSEYESIRFELGTQQLSDIKIDKVEANANGTVQVFYRGLAGVESEAFVKTGAGAYAASGMKDNRAGRRELVVTGVDLTQPVCIQLTSKDACGNTVNSAEVCVPLPSATPVSDENQLTWTASTSANFSKYELFRDDQPIHTATSASSTTFTDSDVECGVTYSYQLAAFSRTDTAISAPIEVTAISTHIPATISAALVSVKSDRSAEILALPPTAATGPYSMIFERSEGSSGVFYEIARTVNDNRFTDSGVSTGTKNYCYRIYYENSCGTRSDASPSVCTIYLQRNGEQIKWTSESPFLDPVENYYVLRIDDSGLATSRDAALTLSHDTNNDPPSNQIFNYQVQAKSADGFYSDSNIIDFHENSSLFIPNAFSPNGDGHNEVFAIKGKFIVSSKMTIFDRWGSVVFANDNAALGWDGSLKSSPDTPAPVGNYFYKIEVTDTTNKTVVKAGTLLLIR